MNALKLMLAVAALGLAMSSARAQNAIDEWASVKLPAAPPLKSAKLDAKETAVLVMDFTRQTCTPERRKRCADQVPRVVKFVEEARAKGRVDHL